MSPREKLNTWVATHGLTIIVYVATLAFGAGAVKAEIAKKADAATVEAMARDIRSIKNLMCRQTPDDSYCEVRR